MNIAMGEERILCFSPLLFWHPMCSDWGSPKLRHLQVRSDKKSGRGKTFSGLVSGSVLRTQARALLILSSPDSDQQRKTFA
jgi:hypothetical protein